ncbi:MAG: FGGY family carbohydrate kinase [Kineosporiaceae bacterium]
MTLDPPGDGPLVLAIDNGSQSTKVALVDAAGRVVASGRRQLRPYAHPAPGHVVHPDDDLWDSIVAACREVLDAYRGDPARIVGVGLCTIRFCRALLDADGALVEPLLSWMDVRVGRPLPTAAEGGDPRVSRLAASSGYITHRLTGAFTDTAANYQGAWPFDPATMAWSRDPAAFTALGMTPAMLPELVPPGAQLGTVTPDAAAATGIPAGLPVFATANDKAVEALGCGLLSPDTALLSLGTYIAAMTPGAVAQGSSEAYWVNTAAVPGEYLYESGGIRRGMWTVGWFRDLAGIAPGDEDLLNAEAAAVPRGCGGLMAVLDWLAPSDAPFRRGALLGFDGTQGRGAVHRAILEGIALTMAGHVEAMEAALGRSFSTLLVSGGGAKADLMMQLLADVFARPTRRTAIADGALLGSAICAAVGAGVHPDVQAAVAAMVEPGAVFTPDPQGVAEYAAVRAVSARLREFTDPLFRWTVERDSGQGVAHER